MNANNNPPQAVFTPVTRHAIFIVATLSPVPAHLAAVRAWCGD
ncbi:TPA: peroxidase, partial [Serratia marcescens]|nr:peroxidase [Serratia marcescens]